MSPHTAPCLLLLVLLLNLNIFHGKEISPYVCDKIYSPVCGVKWGRDESTKKVIAEYRMFNNKCYMESEGYSMYAFLSCDNPNRRNG